jgi:hypothetical protein
VRVASSGTLPTIVPLQHKREKRPPGPIRPLAATDQAVFSRQRPAANKANPPAEANAENGPFLFFLNFHFN